MKRPFKRILYGGDYNPNQWEKEIWKEDMRIFKDARINSATINVFSWAKIQPSEEIYNFTELDEIIDMPVSYTHLFHEHLGYRLIGEFRKCGYKFGRWYHMVWMEKMIGEHPEKPEQVKRFSEI